MLQTTTNLPRTTSDSYGQATTLSTKKPLEREVFDNPNCIKRTLLINMEAVVLDTNNRVREPRADEPVLYLYDSLGPGHVDGHLLARQIWLLEADGHKRVHLRINSGGGSVAQGYSLFAAIRATKMEVHTWADGLALSMAGLIFLAGQKRHMAPWALLMLHNPTLVAEGETEADAAGNAVILERIRGSVVEMYGQCTTLATDKLISMLDAETWLSATQALDLGLATATYGVAEPARKAGMLQMAAAFSGQHQQHATTVNENTVEVEQASQTAEPGLESVSVDENEVSEVMLGLVMEAEPEPVVEIHSANRNTVGQERWERDAAIKRATPPMEKSTIEKVTNEKALLEVQAYRPLPLGQMAQGWTFQMWERRDPAGLLAMRQSKPAEFEALYRAQFGHLMGKRSSFPPIA
jgi:ATP-dependent protease ClpP protease subunit